MIKTLITGAGRGIGYATCVEFLEKGHSVIAVSRNTKELENLCGIYKGVLTIIKTDITSVEGLDKIIESIESKWGALDVLINNAGTLVNKTLEETRLSDYRKTYEVNVFAPAELSRRCLSYLLSGQIRHIVNISSMGGVQGSSKFPGLSAYSSSKGALGILTECMAEELKGEIKVNCLALGAVQTEMLEEAFPGYVAPLTAKMAGAYIVDFALNGGEYQNGKIISLSVSTP